MTRAEEQTTKVGMQGWGDVDVDVAAPTSGSLPPTTTPHTHATFLALPVLHPLPTPPPSLLHAPQSPATVHAALPDKISTDTGWA